MASAVETLIRSAVGKGVETLAAHNRRRLPQPTTPHPFLSGEGWLVGLVIDAVAETTDLVILNAGDIAEEPVACVHLPHRIPPGFHGAWIGRAS